MSIEKTSETAYEKVTNKIEKISEELSCKLNDVEWQNRARELASAQSKLEAEKQRKKDVTKQLNADVAVAENRVSKLANVVETKTEQREVIVARIYNYQEGYVIKVRTDTDAEIDRREMTTLERQSGLFELEAQEDEENAPEGRQDADV